MLEGALQGREIECFELSYLPLCVQEEEVLHHTLHEKDLLVASSHLHPSSRKPAS
mgnify:CR=1 FL=1